MRALEKKMIQDLEKLMVDMEYIKEALSNIQTQLKKSGKRTETTKTNKD